MEQVVQELLEEASDHEQLVRQDLSRDIRVVARPTRTTWVDIDMGALATNVRAIKKIVDNDVMLMAVVKADAYGHGAVRTSQTALLNGAEYLGVSSMSEALELRQAGIDAPILILGYTPPWALHQAVRQKVTITLYDIDMAQSYERAMREVSGTLNVHVKVDTGMGRLGVLPENAVSLFRRLMTLQNLVIEGIYTHFSMADEDPEYMEEQLEVFKGVVRPLRASGFDFKYIHSANSAATLTTPDSHFNMVRVGLALYGLHPSETVQLSDEFLPVMSWKSIVASVKTLPAGHPVGYGNAYITQREERVAIVPVGYADGFRRGPENWGEVLIHGQYAEVLGRISMEKTAVRVTHIPTVSVNDEVVLLGRQGDNAITAEDVARRLGTINYEVVCNALPRVPRTL
jgi:alanine racemase